MDRRDDSIHLWRSPKAIPNVSDFCPNLIPAVLIKRSDNSHQSCIDRMTQEQSTASPEGPDCTPANQ